MADLSPEQYLALEGADTQDEAPGNEVSRRTLLRGVAGVAIGTGLTASGLVAFLRGDTIVGDQIYGGGDPEVLSIDDSVAESRFPRHFNIVGGGFGVYDTENLAGHVHESLGNFGQTAYIKNSNGGFNPEMQKRQVLSYLEERGAEVVNLYGHSMNGMLMTEIGSFLLRNGVEVQSIFLDCSPEKIYDVRPGKRSGAKVLAAFDRYGELLNIYGGPVSRLAMESAARVLDGRVDFEQIVKEALRKTTSRNASTRLLLGQAHYTEAFAGSEWGPDYPRTVAVGKLRPEDWSADPTINNRTALVGWRTDSYRHTTVHDVAVRGGGHANPGAKGAQYTRTLMRFAREMGFYEPPASRAHSGGHPIP